MHSLGVTDRRYTAYEHEKSGAAEMHKDEHKFVLNFNDMLRSLKTQDLFDKLASLSFFFSSSMVSLLADIVLVQVYTLSKFGPRDP